MKIKSFFYKPFLYSRCTADDGETITFNGNEIKDSMGIAHVKGELTCIDCDVPEYIGTKHSFALDGNEIVQTTKIKRQTWTTKGETEWVCFQTTPDIRATRNLVTQTVSGEYTLPSGTGFLVLSGSVTADGMTANQDDYFRARNADLLVSGNGVIILVT
jgi:hypothetical protein